MTLISHSGISSTFTKTMWQAAGSPTEVELGEGWTSIATSAFQLTNITSVVIPASVTTLEDSAFYFAGSLASVTFSPNSELAIIKTSVFRGTNITNIIIPASVTNIGMSCFNNCPVLTTITFIESANSAVGVTIGSYNSNIVFNGSNALAYVFIKNGQVIKNSSGTQINTTLDTTGAFFGSPETTTITSNKAAEVFFTRQSSANYQYFYMSDWSFYDSDGNKLTVESVTEPTNPISGVSPHDGFNQYTQSQYLLENILDSDLSSFWITDNYQGSIKFNFPAGSAKPQKYTWRASHGDWNRAAIPTQWTIYLEGYETSEDIDDTWDTVGNGQVMGPYNLPTPAPANICFPAGTPVLTDQGEVAIDKIDPKKHTIRANKIEGITETTSIENYVVMIKKDAFSRNVPCRDTTISANHKIMFNNQMVKANEFVKKREYYNKIYKVAYTGYTLYNVLLENKHDLMSVNNIIAETLNPVSVNAWLFRMMKSVKNSMERQEILDKYMHRLNMGHSHIEPPKEGLHSFLMCN